MNIQPIQRIENPSFDEFQTKFGLPNKPVIISGVANDWSASSLWQPEMFKDMFGDIPAPLRASDNEIDVFFGQYKEQKVMSIADYIDSINSTDINGQRPGYLGNIPLNSPLTQQYFDKIKSHFSFPDYFPENSGNEIRLWIGATNQKSTIHNDNYHNFNAQIFGKKTFLLFPPEEYEKLSIVKIDDELWSSPIDPQQPDLDKFSSFKEINGLEAELQVGDILFIPAFWWHQARTITTAINLNMWVFTENICKTWQEHPAFSKAVSTGYKF